LFFVPWCEAITCCVDNQISTSASLPLLNNEHFSKCQLFLLAGSIDDESLFGLGKYWPNRLSILVGIIPMDLFILEDHHCYFTFSLFSVKIKIIWSENDFVLIQKGLFENEELIISDLGSPTQGMMLTTNKESILENNTVPKYEVNKVSQTKAKEIQN